MTALLAWVWAPVLIYLVVMGVGLLTDAVLRADLPPAVVPPVGLAVTVVVATLAFRLRIPELVTAVVVLGAVAGFALAVRARRPLWSPPALIAGAVVYALYMAPVVLTGEASWSGYNFVNDTASNFILVNLLEHRGVVQPTGITGADLRANYLVRVGYPLGSFSFLAALRPLTGAPVEAVYQPAIAVLAGLGGMSLTELGRRSGLRPAAAVAASVLALAGVLLYRYAGHGSIKEVALVALVATAVVLATVALERRLAVKPVVLVAVTAVAMVLVFSTAAAAFALSLGLATLAAAALAPDRPSLRHVGRLVAVALAVGVVAALPLLGSLLEFTGNIRDAFSASGGASAGELGQLVRPLPVTEAAGVWLGRDYRFPADSSLNGLLVAGALVCALVGVGWCGARRRAGPLLLLATLLLPALVLAPLSSVYIDAKLLATLTPALVFVAAFGVLALLQEPGRAARVAGGVGLAVLVVGVTATAGYTYRDVKVAPLDRVQAMEDVAGRVPDRGLYLLNEWEEFGKVFMDAARVNPAFEAESAYPVDLRGEAGLARDSPKRTPIFGRWFDLDRQDRRYVARFRGIIMRRSPAASRPPASFRLVYRNRYYELWRRVPGVRVAAHLPLQGRDRATAVPDCAVVRRLAARARRGQRLVAAARPRVAAFSPLTVPKPANWPVNEDPEGTVATRGAGTLRGTLTAQGRQRVWLRASSIRRLTVTVDGRRVGDAEEPNTPGQWIDVGTVRLGPGPHRIEVSRAKASLRPGDSNYGFLGPVALQAAGPGRLVSVAPRDGARLCGRSWDWIELVGR
ncbi:MAG TPA: hypothetical protein VEX39_07730 [Thermoleophilaceae bacterium]|nr:hypothetical protein [Thermoleophilaceae bacterium]